MTMTKSDLTDFSVMSPNYYAGRAYPVTRVTVHHMAGNLTADQCGAVFASTARQASSNYGIGSDGEIACYVDEDNAAWTSSSYDNDNRAITIEVADYDCDNWIPSQDAYDSTVKLCADICQRYGITPTYTGDTRGSFTEHMMFAATGCPGPWWHEHMSDFVQDVITYMEGGDMATPAEVWSFRNSSLEKVDCYQILRDARDYAKQAKAAAEKASTGNVDYDKLANAVADKLAARLKA